MASQPRSRPSRDNLNSRTQLPSQGPSTASGTRNDENSLVSKVMSPFNTNHKKSQSTRILSELAPAMMTPRMVNSTAAVASRPRNSLLQSRTSSPRMDFATLVRAPLRLGLGSRTITSGDLQVLEATDELLLADIPEPEGVASDVSLLRGFQATIPAADQGRMRRRHMRNVDTPRLGLKKLGMNARGLLKEGPDNEGSATSEDDLVVVSSQQKRLKGRESLSAQKRLGKDELTRQISEIVRDKENIHVKRSLCNGEIAEITNKIRALDEVRTKLEKDLLKLQEDELELDDELEGVKERIRFEEQATLQPAQTEKSLHLPPSSRRRKGPAFLPSEHDELPVGVAFMTLESHTTPLEALDFSEPYGILVSASVEDAQPRVWDLLTGSEIGRLRGHVGAVKCLQVEDSVCLTGGEDGNIRLWDLRKVDEDEEWEISDRLPEVIEEDEEGENAEASAIRSRSNSTAEKEKNGPCARVLEGHSRAVTALYFEDECLVTGASDKTLRQWDLNTGQCVMTMDILWAISHPPASTSSAAYPDSYMSGSYNPAAASAWDTAEDFVGGVQFWGYGLVSGSGDGAVRMWDMRTGQAHRTLLGHTGPITCLQFDEMHIATGSHDKTLKLWDLRTGSCVETLQYDDAVTSLQFDSRKIVAAAGDNGAKIYNRTSAQTSTLLTNGHTKPVETLRYMDRYLVTGGRDATVKIWSL